MSRHEALARQKKVDALTVTIWSILSPMERRSDRTVAMFETMLPEFRAHYANVAEVLPPSDTTWAMVVDWIRVHVRWAQQDSAA